MTSLELIFEKVLIVLLFIGIFPNIINCIIFYQKRFRRNACSLSCGLVSTINILILIQGFIQILLSNILESDPENSNLIDCKTRLYIRHSLMMINRSYTIFACFACYALSSKCVNLRLFINRINLIYCFIPLIFFFWLIVCIHIPFNTYIVNNQCIMSEIYQWIFSIYLVIIAGIISPTLMIIFIRFTLKNLKDLHQPRQILNNQSLRLTKRDSQLIRMLLLHVIVYMITTSLYPINMFYEAITQNINKSSERLSIENFILFQTTNFIFYLNNISPFFVYYFVSLTFRIELKNLWLICRNRNRIALVHHVTLITDPTNFRRQPTVAVIS